MLNAVDIKRAFRREGARGQWTGAVTEEEVEQLVGPLCELIAKEKHRKAAERLVGWINSVTAERGYDVLADYLVVRLAHLCRDYDVPASVLDNRVAQIPDVGLNLALKATVRAQQIVAQATDRLKRDQSPRMTAEEHKLLWEDYQPAVLGMYYWLQCLAGSRGLRGLPRVVAALYAPDAVEDPDPREYP
jgi:hypothetical protein